MRMCAEFSHTLARTNNMGSRIRELIVYALDTNISIARDAIERLFFFWVHNIGPRVTVLTTAVKWLPAPCSANLIVWPAHSF